MRRGGAKRRRDANEPEIRDALHAIGVLTKQNHGDGLPDLLTFHRRRGWGVLEVKGPGESLTADQQKLYDVAPFPIVSTVCEALAMFGCVDQ